MREESLRKKNAKQVHNQVRNTGLQVPLSQILATNSNKSKSADTADVNKTGVHETEPAPESEASDEQVDPFQRRRVEVPDKCVHPYGTPFLDYKSSDRVLSLLEERIKLWHASVASIKSHKQIKPGIVKLERVRINVSVSGSTGPDRCVL